MISSTHSDTASIIDLPPVAEAGHASLFEAFRRRRTIRQIDAREPGLQELSNLLWAGWGVNRASGPFGGLGRTAGSASNSQEIDLYVVMAGGAYLFDAVAHRLQRVCKDDLRRSAMTPGQRG